MIGREFTWSKNERHIARKAFDAAYEKELSDIAQEAARRIKSYKTPKDLWALHDYLTNKRIETDNKYDYRYGVIILVFGRLMKDGYISRDDLLGISESKIEAIEEYARITEAFETEDAPDEEEPE